jgi:hypothetical protein
MGHFQGEIPVIPSFLILNGRRPVPVLFLVDTGCTRTILSYTVAESAGINLKGLECVDIGGIGGNTKVYELSGDIQIGLLDEEAGKLKKVHVEPLNCIYVFGKEDDRNPSLLGWDVLSRFDSSFNRQHNEINLKRLNVPPRDHHVLTLKE